MPGIFDSAIFDQGIYDEESGSSVSATDAPSFSDTATRIVTLARTATDTRTTSDTAARIATLARTASDTRTTSDAAIAGLFLARTAADTRTTSDTATRILSLHRTVSQTVTTSDTAARTGSFARTISDHVTIDNAAARIVASSQYAIPGGPISPPPGSPTQPAILSLNPIIRNGIVILVDGVDITADVVIEEASFVSMVNGQPGSCAIKVKDPNRNKSFTTGVRITLDIAGNRVWAGYLGSVKRVYAFSDHSPQTRFLLLEGPDINILLHKRVVEDQASPTTMLGPAYPKHTKDITTIHDLVAGWLDLSGDDLVTGAYVENIGDVNVDQVANLWQAGWEWASAMSTIARLTQAIFYLTPDRHLVYTDVNTANAPYVMSDTPSVSQVSYRELSIDSDGSNLINDALIWGVGGGDPHPVFKRLTSAGSVTSHGTWQYGTTYAGVWKQASVDKIADSLVNGSPLSKRGAKNDRMAVSLTTFTPGFLPAQKIDFTSNAFGFTDVIPVRRMEVNFPGGNPRYRLTLSHEIDLPFDLFDLVPAPSLSGWTNPLPVPLIPPVIIPGGCDCSITDAFDRVVASDLGTATCGLPWTIRFNDPANLFSVDGSEAIIAMDTIDPFSGGDDLQLSGIEIPRWIDDVVSGTVDFWIDTVSATLGAIFAPEFRSGDFNFQTFISSNAGIGKLQLTANGGAPASVVKNDWVASTWYTMRFLYDHANGIQAIKIWPRASTEPGSWDLTRSTASDTWRVVTPARFLITLSPYFHTGTTFKIANLDITGVNRCTENRFDNFDRTTSSGFGTSSSGYLYASDPSGTSMGADGSSGYVVFPGGGDIATAEIATDGPWRTPTGFVMTARMQVTTLPPIGQNVVVEIGTFHDSFGVFDGVDLKLTTDNAFAPADSTLGLWHNSVQPDQLASPPTLVYFTGQTGRYNIKWEYRPPLTRVRLWHESDPEPTTWDIEVSDAVHNGDETFWSSFSHVGGGTTTLRIDDIDFDYADKPCYIDGGIPVPPTVGSASPSIRVCTQFVTDSATSVFTVSGSYVAGSLEVSINGLRQTLNVDYTETDPAFGVFTMTTSPLSSETLGVCYYYLTEGGSGGSIRPKML